MSSTTYASLVAELAHFSMVTATDEGPGEEGC